MELERRQIGGGGFGEGWIVFEEVVKRSCDARTLEWNFTRGDTISCFDHVNSYLILSGTVHLALTSRPKYNAAPAI